MRLIRSKFQSWLRAKPAEEIVGQQRDSHTCPIANFYCDESGGDAIVIFSSDYGYVIDRGYDRRLLPHWAACFVSFVDGEPRPEISASRALELLTEIRP